MIYRAKRSRSDAQYQQKPWSKSLQVNAIGAISWMQVNEKHGTVCSFSFYQPRLVVVWPRTCTSTGTCPCHGDPPKAASRPAPLKVTVRTCAHNRNGKHRALTLFCGIFMPCCAAAIRSYQFPWLRSPSIQLDITVVDMVSKQKPGWRKTYICDLHSPRKFLVRLTVPVKDDPCRVICFVMEFSTACDQ